MPKPDGVLVAAFRGLTKERVANFRWHMKKGTPILCGKDWAKWSDGEGGG